MNYGQPASSDSNTLTPSSSTATVSAASTSRSEATHADAPCKVAFVDVDVAMATPRTSCRSMASSDSGDNESIMSLSVTSSRDDDDQEVGVPASSASTWSTYVYFYPRHDMTYTRCLLTTSRHVHCDGMSSTSVSWPALPGDEAGGQDQSDTACSAVDSRWRRRVNASRTPFWFPVVRSYDSAAPAYLCYPRHDLSYAEVEASRVDRQPGVEHSSLQPFSTILEELTTDDAASQDEEDLSAPDCRTSVLVDDEDHNDIGPAQSPACGATFHDDDLRSTTSSLISMRHSDDELKPTTVGLLLSPRRYDENAYHDLTSNDWCPTTPRHPILTPVTKLDLRSFEVVTCRQRVIMESGGSARTRPVVGGPVGAEKVRRLRRCSSDPAVRAAGRQSPVRDPPLSARVVRKRNRSYE